MAVAAHTQAFEHLLLDFLAYLEFERGLSRNTLEATAPTCSSTAPTSGVPGPRPWGAPGD